MLLTDFHPFREEFVCVCVCLFLCLILCNSMDCRLRHSSVHGILQARILEWVAITFSRSSWPRDWTWVSCITGRFFISEPPGKPQRTVSLMLSNITAHGHFNHFRKSPSDRLPVSKITLFWLNFWLLLEYRYFIFWHKWDITLPLEKIMDMCSHCFSLLLEPFLRMTIIFLLFKSRIFFFFLKKIEPQWLLI